MDSCSFSIIIPAAGASQRLGQAKQLIDVNGQTLLQHTVQKAAFLPADEIIVITGSFADKLPSKHVLNQGCQIPVRVQYNPNWSDGIGTSIALGARSIHQDTAGLMILLCDQWRIESADLQKLLEAWLCDPSRLVASFSGAITGPPVIFPRQCFKALSRLQGDKGAQGVLQSYAHLLELVDIRNAAADLDTPFDLVQLRENVLKRSKL